MPPLLPQERSRRPYFAFGSNMLATQMHQRCPAAQDRGMARLDGWQFLINQEGYATIVPEQSAYVLGVLWSLTSACEAALDDYEEIATGLYTKAYLEIRGTQALVYLATHALPGPPWQAISKPLLLKRIGVALIQLTLHGTSSHDRILRRTGF